LPKIEKPRGQFQWGCDRRTLEGAAADDLGAPRGCQQVIATVDDLERSQPMIKPMSQHSWLAPRIVRRSGAVAEHGGSRSRSKKGRCGQGGSGVDGLVAAAAHAGLMVRRPHGVAVLLTMRV